MHTLVFLIAVIVALPAWAGEPTEFYKYLHSLPRLAPDVRQSFVAAMGKGYDSQCECARFILDGEVWKVQVPPSDATIRLMIDLIKDGELIPISPKTGA